MTHTDDRSIWTELDDSIADIIVGYTESMNDDEGKSHIDRIIDLIRADERKRVHADIAARAMSDEVIGAVHQAFLDGLTARHLNESGAFHSILIGEAVAETIPALLLALGITEGEAEV